MRKLWILPLGLFVACGTPTTPTHDLPQPVEKTVVATFMGSFDATSGTLSIDQIGSQSQGLWGGANVIQDGTPGTGPGESVELVTTNYGENLAGCGADNLVCGDVTITSFYGTADLYNVHVELTNITPSAGHEGQNSAASFMGVSNSLGLWSYGNILSASNFPPGTYGSSMMTWELGNDAVDFSFNGVVWADTCAAAGPPTGVFINELHYDNTGTDTGEFVEVAGPAGTDLAGWNIELYNGNGGALYATIPLSGTIPNQMNGAGALSFAHSGIQNGSPDGLALINTSTTVVQFLSYEGSLTASGGVANGMTSVDIGVTEPGVPVGNSLRLAGAGANYADFTWQNDAPASPGAVNQNQVFCP